MWIGSGVGHSEGDLGKGRGARKPYIGSCFVLFKDPAATPPAKGHAGGGQASDGLLAVGCGGDASLPGFWVARVTDAAVPGPETSRRVPLCVTRNAIWCVV